MTSQRIFNINLTLTKIAKHVSYFVLVASTSVIYKDKASIEQYLHKACMFHFFCTTLYFIALYALFRAHHDVNLNEYRTIL